MDKLDLVLKHNDLIFDVGMHKGEDTEYYLKKGFRVVGFEANPDLADQLRTRFADAIEDERLTIVEGAIVDAHQLSTSQPIKFYGNVNLSVWGTTSESWAARNVHLGTRNEIIDVRAIDFRDCLRRYGMPYYMKIDIEGADRICLESLLDFEVRPDYLSIESEKVDFDKLEEEVNLLKRLGYNAFQAVQQANIALQKQPNPAKEGVYVPHTFELGCSGLFGKDLPDDWTNYEQLLSRYRKIFVLYRLFGDYSLLIKLRFGKRTVRRLERFLRRPLPGWYDTHARHSSVVSPRMRQPHLGEVEPA